MFQNDHFPGGEIAHESSGQVFFGQAPKINTVEFDHLIAEMLEDTSDNPVASKMEQ